MIKREKALRFNVAVLSIIAIVDLVRGYMHTFNIQYASQNIAQIDPHPDALYLMGVFGMSNFLTGFIYLLIVWKAKHIAPFILAILPLAYFLGILGINYQGVTMNSAFNGQYMMYTYFSICFISLIIYFISKKEA